MYWMDERKRECRFLQYEQKDWGHLLERFARDDDKVYDVCSKNLNQKSKENLFTTQ